MVGQSGFVSHRYPREGQPIAPLALKEILAVAPPGGSLRDLQLKDLDASAWSRFEARTCLFLANAVISQTHRWADHLPVMVAKRKVGPWPESLRLEGLEIGTGTYNSLARAGFGESPEALAALTIEDLLSIRWFGTRALVDFLSALDWVRSGTTSRLGVPVLEDEQVDWQIEARRLARMKEVREILWDDPRLGSTISEVLSSAPASVTGSDLSAFAMALVETADVPASSEQLRDGLRRLRLQIRAASQLKLEEELDAFLSFVGSEKQRKLVARRLGWDGGGGSTLQEAADLEGISRERVRQLEKKLADGLQQSAHPFAPALDAALAYVEGVVPAKDQDLALALAKEELSEQSFDLKGLLTAATMLGREATFTLASVGTGGMCLPLGSEELGKAVATVARKSIEHWGVATVEDVAARVSGEHQEAVQAQVVRDVLSMLEGFEWLDEASGWFWISTVTRSRLLNQIEKIMSVADRIHVAELRAGVSRHYRTKGFAPPRKVLLALCARLPGYRVEGDFISDEPALDYREVLGDVEETFARVLMEEGPLLTGKDLEEKCLAAGMNQSTFYVYLSYSPIIARYARGVYGLRGAEVPPGLADSLVPKIIRTKVVQDHGWAEDGTIWIAYKLTAATVSSGVVTIPAALKKFVAGPFRLLSEEGAEVGTFVAKDTSAWGLSPLFRRRGGEAGDTLVVTFDLAKREAVARLGDEELLESAAQPARSDSEAIPVGLDA